MVAVNERNTRTELRSVEHIGVRSRRKDACGDDICSRVCGTCFTKSRMYDMFPAKKGISLLLNKIVADMSSYSGSMDFGAM